MEVVVFLLDTVMLHNVSARRLVNQFITYKTSNEIGAAEIDSLVFGASDYMYQILPYCCCKQ